MKKKCIFHIPLKINTEHPSGSQIRPMKMIQAFRNIGYDVDIVMGYGEEREKQIKSIVNNIKNGTIYEFLYSESSTMPTLLTEKNHIPKYPFLDFNFLKHCKSKGIKIGLFYRDIHWNFEQYKNNVSKPKQIISRIFYKYDLKKYNKLIDILYLPSIKMKAYIPDKLENLNVKDLPPAIDSDKPLSTNKYVIDDKLTIFYVGGVGDLYNSQKLFEVVYNNNFLNLIFCTRKEEWEKEKSKYSKFLNDRIKIIHASGDELNKYFDKADICSIFVNPTEYWKFAMPVKMFQYMQFLKPTIACSDTAPGEFINNNDIGWTINYDENELDLLLNQIYKDKKLIYEKVENIEKLLKHNTWQARAYKVAQDLSAK